jgi:hypothetical protein
VAGKVKERTLRLKDLGIESDEAIRERKRKTVEKEKALENGEGGLAGPDVPSKRPPPVEERTAHEEYLQSIVYSKEKQLKDLKWRIASRNEEIKTAQAQQHTLVCLIEKQRNGGHGKDNSALSIEKLDFSLDDDEID